MIIKQDLDPLARATIGAFKANDVVRFKRPVFYRAVLEVSRASQAFATAFLIQRELNPVRLFVKRAPAGSEAHAGKLMRIERLKHGGLRGQHHRWWIAFASAQVAFQCGLPAHEIGRPARPLWNNLSSRVAGRTRYTRPQKRQFRSFMRHARDAFIDYTADRRSIALPQARTLHCSSPLYRERSIFSMTA